METIRQIDAYRSALAWRRDKRTVGLVATTGDLHAGQIGMIKLCRDKSDISVASIYPNPLLPTRDKPVSNDPRQLSKDQTLLESLSVDFLFAPRDEEMFPGGTDKAMKIHCNWPLPAGLTSENQQYRDSQATVWLKMLNIVEPDQVIFGEKDYVGLILLKRLIDEFSFDTQIIRAPVIRDADGVAFSGRLSALTVEQRKQAPILHQTLQDLAFALTEGARNYAKLEQTARIALRGGGFDNQAVTICDADTLAGPNEQTRRLRIIADADLGGVQLHDNIGIDL